MKIRFTTLCLLTLLSTSTVIAQVKDYKRVSNDSIPAAAYFDKGKLTFKSNDGAFKLSFDNRVYLDAAVYSPSQDISVLGSDPNGDIEDMGYSGSEDDGLFKFSSGMTVRRARFGIKATLYEKYFGELDLDFAFNEVELKDMFIGYKFSDRLQIKVGNFKEPLSMERLTSSRYLTAMERPMAVQSFAGGRKLGIGATAWGEHWWLSGGVFGSEVSILQKERNRGSDGWGVSARAAFSPIVSNDFTLHIGGYGSYRTPEAWGSDEKRWVYFAAFPESRVDNRRFVRAKIGKDGDGGYVDNYQVYGIELALKYRKLLIYGEYIAVPTARYDFDVEGNRFEIENANFGGWYATASYMILGEQKRYAKEDAEFAPAGSRNKKGNLELSARISTIDLNDASQNGYWVQGGSATSYTASLSWSPVNNVLLALNYMFMDNDKYADDKGDIFVKEGNLSLQDSPDWQNGIDFSTIQIRLLLSF